MKIGISLGAWPSNINDSSHSNQSFFDAILMVVPNVSNWAATTNDSASFHVTVTLQPRRLQGKAIQVIRLQVIPVQTVVAAKNRE